MRKLFFFAFLFLAITAARAEQVVFSEIMYHPVGDKPEFIEVWKQHELKGIAFERIGKWV